MQGCRVVTEGEPSILVGDAAHLHPSTHAASQAPVTPLPCLICFQISHSGWKEAKISHLGWKGVCQDEEQARTTATVGW